MWLIMSKLHVWDRLLAAEASSKQCVEPQLLVPGIAQAIEPEPLREAAPPLRPSHALTQAGDCTLPTTTSSRIPGLQMASRLFPARILR